MRGRRGTVWISIAAGLALGLAIANIVVVELNRGIQAQVNVRNHFIQQSIQLEALNREIVGALANLAVERNDDALKTMLTQHGITFNTAAGASRGQSTAPGSQPGTRR